MMGQVWECRCCGRETYEEELATENPPTCQSCFVRLGGRPLHREHHPLRRMRELQNAIASFGYRRGILHHH